MIALFDMDGTLVDTHDAVLASYRAAGVEPPPGWWGQPWRAWLDSEEAHNAKNAAYPGQLWRARRLPTTTVLARHARAGDVCVILTSASAEAARLVLDHFCITASSIYCDMTLEAKIDYILNLGSADACYYDDNLIACQAVRLNINPTTFAVYHVIGRG